MSPLPDRFLEPDLDPRWGSDEPDQPVSGEMSVAREHAEAVLQAPYDTILLAGESAGRLARQLIAALDELARLHAEIERLEKDLKWYRGTRWVERLKQERDRAEAAEAEIERRGEALREIQERARFDKGHPTFDAIAEIARTALAQPRHKAARETVLSRVVADLHERDRVGRETYGTSLMPHNGRVALRDAYEEALDLAMYLRQELDEREARQEAALEAEA